MKLPLLLQTLAAKKACTRCRFTAGYVNTPYLCKEYYHTRLLSDISQSFARS
jgi:hypothetical protein